MKNLAAITVVGAMTLAATLASGQSRPAMFQQVVTIDVKPGHVQDWVDYQNKIKEAATKLGAAQTFNVFHVSLGENRNRFYVVLPFEKWSDMEGWTSVRAMLVGAFGEKEGLEILARGTAAEEHNSNGVTRYLPDHSSNMSKNTMSIAPMYQVIQTQVRADANSSYQAWLALLAKAQNADESRAPSTRRVSTLGSSWLYTTSMPMQSMADRDEPGGAGTASFYGESVAGRLTDMVGDGVISRTWLIVHHHPDQSYSGPSASSN